VSALGATASASQQLGQAKRGQVSSRTTVGVKPDRAMMSNSATKACVSGGRFYLCHLQRITSQSHSAVINPTRRWMCIGQPMAAQLRNSSRRVTCKTTRVSTAACASISSRFMSTETEAKKSSLFAAVDHSDEYEKAMSGRHGGQLALAYDEGIGKDDAPFDPFALLDEAEKEFEEELEGDEYEDIEEAEYNEEAESDDDDEDDDIEEGEVIDAYDRFNTDGSIRRSESEKVALRAGAPAGGLFAIIDLAGSQQKVTLDDVVIVNKLKPVDKWSVGSVHTLTADDVLLLGSSHLTLVGLPGVKGAEVDLMVEEITKDEKVIVFKKRRRKHSRRKNGFRRDVTMLRVLDIRFPEKFSAHEYRGKDEEK